MCKSFYYSVGGRVRGVGLDTTAASTIFNTDSDVTFVTPSGSPGVLDHVVIGTVQRSVTNGKNSVVMGLTATRADNTRLVVRENASVGLNGDRNRLFGNSGLKLRGGILGDSMVRGNGDVTLRRFSFAGTISSCVRVVRLQHHGVRFSVGESTGGATTVATMGTSVAINKLLFREGKKLTSLDLVGTFHSTSGAE